MKADKGGAEGDKIKDNWGNGRKGRKGKKNDEERKRESRGELCTGMGLEKLILSIESLKPRWSQEAITSKALFIMLQDVHCGDIIFIISSTRVAPTKSGRFESSLKCLLVTKSKGRLLLCLMEWISRNWKAAVHCHSSRALDEYGI